MHHCSVGQGCEPTRSLQSLRANFEQRLNHLGSRCAVFNAKTNMYSNVLLRIKTGYEINDHTSLFSYPHELKNT